MSDNEKKKRHSSNEKKRHSPPTGPGDSSRSPFAPGRSAFPRIFFWVFLALLVLPYVLRQFAPEAGREISYTRFRGLLEAGQVASIRVQGQEVRGSLQKAAESPEGESFDRFHTLIPSFGDETLFADLRDRGVEIRAEAPRQSFWWPMLVSVMPFLALLLLGIFFISRLRGQSQGLFSIGKSRARLYQKRQERTGFADVAGADRAKKELSEIVDFLRDPRRLRRLGGKPPRGILLVGPPGTGKTLLARATAGEADVPFFSITGSDFMEMFVGVGASRVRDLFRDARKSAPSIVFIDELDSVGRRRGAGLGGGHDEREQTLNQLLSEMDGFEPNESVIVLAATNRPDILDPALLRPGRFDRQVTLDLPTAAARKAILKIHTRGKPLAEDVDLERIARSTPGFSGADLENLLNEAALLAGRDGKMRIGARDVEAARDKLLLGLQREGLALTEEECKLLAYHEGGHALVAAVLPHADPVYKVTIVPRGRSMGVTQQMPERDKYIYSREYLLDRLAVMMGGRAAEEEIFATSSSGSENDLKEALHLTRRMVLDWGMSDELHPVALGGARQHVFLGEEISRGHEYSESTAQIVDRSVQAILEEAFERARKILQEHRGVLDQIAAALLEHEEISGEAVKKLFERGRTEKARTESGKLETGKTETEKVET